VLRVYKHILLPVIAWTLLVLLTAPMMRNAALTIDYQVNRASYLEDCQNKDKPMMHCDGKCVLAQKLQQAEQQQAPQPPLLSEESAEYDLTTSLDLHLERIFEVLQPCSACAYHFLSTDRIDHPPQFA
jgi:hypothetical protein